MKNLALMAHITTELDELPLIRLARNEGVQHVSMVGGAGINERGDYLVFLNGECFTTRKGKKVPHKRTFFNLFIWNARLVFLHHNNILIKFF